MSEPVRPGTSSLSLTLAAQGAGASAQPFPLDRLSPYVRGHIATFVDLKDLKSLLETSKQLKVMVTTESGYRIFHELLKGLPPHRDPLPYPRIVTTYTYDSDGPQTKTEHTEMYQPPALPQAQRTQIIQVLREIRQTFTLCLNPTSHLELDPATLSAKEQMKLSQEVFRTNSSAVASTPSQDGTYKETRKAIETQLLALRSFVQHSELFNPDEKLAVMAYISNVGNTASISPDEADQPKFARYAALLGEIIGMLSHLPGRRIKASIMAIVTTTEGPKALQLLTPLTLVYNGLKNDTTNWFIPGLMDFLRKSAAEGVQRAELMVFLACGYLKNSVDAKSLVAFFKENEIPSQDLFTNGELNPKGAAQILRLCKFLVRYSSPDVKAAKAKQGALTAGAGAGAGAGPGTSAGAAGAGPREERKGSS